VDEELSFTRIVGPPADAAPLPVPPSGAYPALVWRPSLGEEQFFDLVQDAVRVGRHEENDIVLAGPTVSGRHAVVRREGSHVVIEDEGSLNGTFVNGERVEQRLLEGGDRIQIGPHLLVFVPAADAAA
jgi:pSer/pThr/pTyr-binding forkhead associated (FHA) protein